VLTPAGDQVRLQRQPYQAFGLHARSGKNLHQVTIHVSITDTTRLRPVPGKPGSAERRRSPGHPRHPAGPGPASAADGTRPADLAPPMAPAL
jgi:hypothetical protein